MRLSRLSLMIGYLATTWASLVLRSAFPKYAIANADYDDALFVKLADHLRHMEWLGPYNELTLAKGMFYPAFIAVAHVLRLPLVTAEQILYLTISFCFAYYLSQKTARHSLGLAAYVILAFNPVFWNPQLARIIREDVYISLSLAVVLAFLLIFFPLAVSRKNRIITFASAAAGGVLCGCYWLTREEGIWLLPTVITIIVIAVLGRLFGLQADPRRIFFKSAPNLGEFIAPTLLLIVGFSFVVGSVRAMNYFHYGEFEAVEFHADDFINAYGALSRVQQNEWRRYVVFPKDARDRAYSVSSAALELKPYFEGPKAAVWTAIGCYQQGGGECSEISSGWFMWALRGAAEDARSFKSGAEAMRFYKELATEINAGCTAKSIPCGPPRSSLAPAYRQEYFFDTLHAAEKLAPILGGFGDGSVGSPPSVGTPEQLKLVRANVIGTTSNDDVEMLVRGWVATTGGKPSISLGSKTAQPLSTSVVFSDATDVDAAMPGMHGVRFAGRMLCGNAICEVRIGRGDHEEAHSLVKGAALVTDNTKIFLDQFEPASGKVRQSAWTAKFAELIASIYHQSFPTLEGLAGLGVALSLLATWLYGDLCFAAVVAVVSLTAVLSRIALLAYLEVTSIPSLNILYASPASGFVLIFTLTGIYAGLSSVRRFLSPFTTSVGAGR